MTAYKRSRYKKKMYIYYYIGFRSQSINIQFTVRRTYFSDIRCVYLKEKSRTHSVDTIIVVVVITVQQQTSSMSVAACRFTMANLHGFIFRVLFGRAKIYLFFFSFLFFQHTRLL